RFRAPLGAKNKAHRAANGRSPWQAVQRRYWRPRGLPSGASHKAWSGVASLGQGTTLAGGSREVVRAVCLWLQSIAGPAWHGASRSHWP
ncbi:MAG: hypothetical protein AAF736_04710, partial [Pseudomonadota bacterium]